MIALMEKRVETGWLLDFYGPLLTPRQQALLRLYCEEDLSLSEIAEQEGVTRQAVHAAIQHGDRRLREFVRQLGLLERYRRLYAALRQCRDALAQMTPTQMSPAQRHATDAAGEDRAVRREQPLETLGRALARLADEEGYDGL
jgi:predicted DNA-binding protein YlxM (UPF0122 family)